MCGVVLLSAVCWPLLLQLLLPDGSRVEFVLGPGRVCVLLEVDEGEGLLCALVDAVDELVLTVGGCSHWGCTVTWLGRSPVEWPAATLPSLAI